MSLFPASLPSPWSPAQFAPALRSWFAQHGRHDLPWQQPPTPYRVWLSEIMLQQTQVAVVIPYFHRFVQQFPSVANLAAAPIDSVLQHWSGLGYYARARHLHRAAQLMVTHHAAQVPADLSALLALPGIGRSTAGAILSFAYGQRQPILDGNVKRVFTRCFAIGGWCGEAAVAAQLWQLAEQLLPPAAVAAHNQALMDVGATVCTRTAPRCRDCPLAAQCQALAAGTTAQYPTPKPRRQLPIRQTQWLVIRPPDVATVLLHQRPPRGIWGGLWTLPELAVTADAAAWCQAQLRGDIAQITPLLARRHTFTHFHLDIHPSLVTLAAPAAEVTPPLRWWALADCHALGIPAPLRRLLVELTTLSE